MERAAWTESGSAARATPARAREPAKDASLPTSSDASTTSLARRPARTRGHTFISDDVISIIARRAAEQTEGVHQIGESSLRTVLSRFGRHHGVEAEVGLKEAAVDIEVIVEFGHPIREVTQDLRESVIGAVENMTGRDVVEVDIHVVDIHVPETRAPARRRQLE
jgi:uncharacterized alkaline shock family protein YloU